MNTPWIQVSIDTQSVSDGREHIEHALAVDAEWVEVGTPLITFAGIGAIADVAGIATGRSIVADFKAMDGVAQYFRAAASLGASVATVMASATEASVRAAIAAAHGAGIAVQVDLLGIPASSMASTVRHIAGLGADYFLIHLSIDQLLADSASDPLAGLDEAVAASDVPVGPVVFSAAQGVDAVRRGASYVVVGYPILTAPDARRQLEQFAQAVRSGESR